MNRPEGSAETKWEKVSGGLLLLLIVSIPFEFRVPSPYPTHLQLLFFAFMAASAPAIFRQRRQLIANRAIVAALLFVTVMWIAAFAGSGSMVNAAKAAARYSAGAGLLIALAVRGDTVRVRQAWTAAAVAAAAYALLDFNGFGFPRLFRDMEFYFEDARRLSGSFEYPNAAAAYYAMSLPIVWAAIERLSWRLAASALLWAALILTYSRGAVVAAVVVFAIWALAQRQSRSWAAVAIGLPVFAVLLLQNPLLEDRIIRTDSRMPRNAAFNLSYNMIRERPDSPAVMPVTIRNTGRDVWRSTGEGKVSLSYYWYDTVRKEILNADGIDTPLPRDVRPDETVTISARFHTPAASGLYLLDWDLRYPPRNWFTTEGVPPGVVESDIQKDAVSWQGKGDVSRWYKKPSDPGPIAAADLPRSELWRAAVMLAAAHPLLGIGPDNYRLEYGKALGFNRWDDHLHSNSLYLEILVGGGLFGLAAFFYLLVRVSWSCASPLLAIGVSLIHGLLDFFLMTTPIYFGFWILMGSGLAEAHEDRV